ncbi:hypothetical protein GCM10009555_017780 [Acrocarpospora macrocephala]|uniref:Uncharacterized protein n=1 Tax=Acrocarpospora macrocephala TaxID=150177 RepID=A0A5M3WM91_9ACTN|nr:hypothetical protein [Acrocarpospora macrocephala]GES07438.1 hypothetical protein Amac_010330 [Acrocarpospora macrocephala]
MNEQDTGKMHIHPEASDLIDEIQDLHWKPPASTLTDPVLAEVFAQYGHGRRLLHDLDVMAAMGSAYHGRLDEARQLIAKMTPEQRQKIDEATAVIGMLVAEFETERS